MLALALALSVGVWSEFLPYDQVTGQLPALHGRLLLVAVKPADIGSPGLRALWRAAEAEHVALRPWLLLPPEEGYWASKWNAPAVRAHVRRFLDGMQGLSVPWVTLDVEPPAALTTAMAARLAHGDVWGARGLLAEASRSASLLAARRAYQGLAAELHERGVKVHAVTSSSVLDEVEDGGLRLQSALGTPIDGVPWDELTFMVYRPEFERWLGGLGADLVYRYATVARERYGARAGLDVGEVGAPGFPAPVPGYVDPSQLRADLAAVGAAGLGRVDVYGLDGMVLEGGVARWLDLPASRRPPASWKVGALRAFFGAMAGTLPLAF